MNRPRTSYLPTAAGFLFALATLIALPTFGANSVWKGSTGDNKWKTAGNWLGGTAPSPGDSLFFNGNVALPLANWTFLTNGTFDANGNFAVTNATTGDRRFYILHVP